jgi:iron complex outermembrane receptor protein
MKKVFLFMMTGLLSLNSVFAEQETDSIKWLELQEVEVVSTRATAKTPVAFSNMSKAEIEKVNFGQDIPFLLTLTPSVIATSDAGTGMGYTGFRVRGTDANRINVTANGIPLNDPESHGVFWVNMPDFASSLQDLQVQRGVGTSTNGSGAFGASINMKTENFSADPYAEFNGGYGSFNTSRAAFKLGSGVIKDHWAFDARLSSINSDGFIDRASVDLKSYFAQGAYFNDKTMVKFITFGGKERTYIAWDGVPKDSLNSNRTYNPGGFMGNDANGNPRYYKDHTDNYNQTHYHLILLQELTSDLRLNAALHYTRGKGFTDEFKRNQKFHELELPPFVKNVGDTIKRSDLVREKHLDNHFGGGIFSLDYRKDKLNTSFGGAANYYDGDHFGYVTWVKNYAGNPDFFPNHEYYRNRGKKFDSNIYLKANYQIFDDLSLFGDVQYRYIDYKINGKNDRWNSEIGALQGLDIDKTFHFVNPKAGVFYDITNESKAYASLAVAHREPNRSSYIEATSTNDMPRAEELINYEVGYKFANKTFVANAGVYYMQYRDQLVPTGEVSSTGRLLTRNVPDSYRAGVEVALGAKLTDWLTWNGNITLSENKIKEFTEYVDNWTTGEQETNRYENTNISFSPNVIANSLFSAHYKGFRTLVQSSYVGRQYLDNTGNNDRSIDPYFVSNLILGYTFKPIRVKELSVNLQINNIFNEKYESNGWVYSYYTGSNNDLLRTDDIGLYPQAGTNVMANIVLKF